ncbi:lipoprotein [soil metagenome]
MSVPFSRRRLLASASLSAGAGLFGGLLSGCTGGERMAAPAPTTDPPPDPLEPVLTGSLGMVGAYDAAIAAHPSLAGRLVPLREQTIEHVRALQLALALPTTAPSAAPTTSTALTASSTPTASAPVTPSVNSTASAPPTEAPASTLANLRAQLAQSRAATAQLCLTTTAQRAPLLGSLSAAGACHDLLLA